MHLNVSRRNRLQQWLLSFERLALVGHPKIELQMPMSGIVYRAVDNLIGYPEHNQKPMAIFATYFSE